MKKIEKPILLSTDMVNATLNGIKKVTRRILNPQPPAGIDYFEYIDNGEKKYFLPKQLTFRVINNPQSFFHTPNKYYPGIILWVRETWQLIGYSNESAYEIDVEYKAAGSNNYNIDLDDEELWERIVSAENKKPMQWRPSIFLPRAASRIDLLTDDVKIERLHELDDDEARLEGFKHREDFIKYWNILNTGRGFPWETNPWVYRIAYTVKK